MANKSLRILIAGAVTIAAGAALPAMASSHREAPGITMTPKLDATDFFMFRSYEAGRSDYVTIIADYLPDQDPRGGPNFFKLDPDAFYDINIDNVGDAHAHLIFRFVFQNKIRGLTVPVNGSQVAIPLNNDGTVAGPSSPALNVVESYKVGMITLNKDGSVKSAIQLTNTEHGEEFYKPVDNIGDKSIPNYKQYASKFIYNIKFPGCAGIGKIFVGQRKDPFYVNLGETFDLVNIKHPIGEAYANSAQDALAAANVTSLAVEAPINCLKAAGRPVIGGWTTSAKVAGLNAQQVSRLGNPLVNELAIGLPDKDKFNASAPSGDLQFAKYITTPALPALLHILYPGLTAPTQFPRQDLTAVFLTGIKGLNQPANVVGSEEMRLNVTIPAVSAGQQNPLGAIAGDNAGYPNGRRPADDVIDISLRVFMGKLYALGKFGGKKYAPSGDVELVDGVRKSAKKYDDAFPYALTPIPGSPNSAFDAAVAADR